MSNSKTLLWTLMSLLLLSCSTGVKGFVTKKAPTSFVPRQQHVAQLHATPPTMVIYW